MKKALCIAISLLMVIIAFSAPFGQSAEAVAIVDDALILIIIAALAGMGIYFTAQSTSDAAAWVRTQINASGIDFTGSSYGTNRLSNILVNNTFLGHVSLLAQYIRTQYSLTDNTQTSIQSQRFMYLQDGSRVFTMNVSLPFNGQWPTAGEPASGTLFSVYEEYQFENGTIIRTNIYDDQTRDLEIVGQNGTVTKYGYISRSCNAYVFCTNYYNYSGSGLIPMRVAGVTPSGYIDENSVSSNSDWNSIFLIISDDVLGLKTGQINIPTDQQIGTDAGIISIPTTWGRTMPQILDDVTTYVPAGTMIGTTTLTIAPTTTVEQQVDQTATNAQTISTDAEQYQTIGLEDVFPFCLPFDIYHFLSALAADPEAPYFEWRFYVPGICDETIEIDLAAFDTVAQILRTMELLAFIVGLAFVTRSRMIRS